MMTPERWQQVKDILHQALELKREERSGFLDRACPNDESLRREVESLLEVQGQAEGFMENSIQTDSLGPNANTGDSSNQAPSRTPPFGFVTNYERIPGFRERFDLPFIRGSTSGHSLEIRDLLRRRLQIVVLISLFGNIFMNAVRFVRLDRPLFTQANLLHTWATASANLMVMAVLTIMLWRKRIYTLPQLRWLEAVAFGAASLYFLADTYFSLFEFSNGYLLTYAQRHPQEIVIVARLASMLWVVLIIAYGIFIPNTGRRCAAVTLGMALSCLGVVTLGGLLHPSLPGKLLMLFLADMTLWLGIAVAMAIYGSHKITVLRQEAFTARKLGQYDLKQRLGQGGMGEVYLAEHALLKRPCAIKVIRPDQADNPATLQRFLREVQATAGLTHPNTVQIFDYGQADDGTVFYAMEYLPGMNLQGLVERYGPLDPRRAVHVLRQLCDALAEAHAVGLIHRDIKPSNVILCSRGGLYDVAKLLDFGLVRLQSTDRAQPSFTQGGLIFGTPEYMSPEQASGKQELNALSDIYSLGGLTWFLLTGKPPFVREGVIQTLAAHISEPILSIRNDHPELPEDLDAIVQTCLAKVPNQRFPSVTSLDEALSKCRSANAWTQAEAAAWWKASDAGQALATQVA